MNNRDFLNYQALKKKFNVNYKGYSLKYIMATDFLFYSYNKSIKDINLKNCKRNIFRVNTLNKLKVLLTKKVKLFSFDNYGSDYRITLCKIMELVNNADLYEGDQDTIKQINIKNILTSLPTLINFIRQKLPLKVSLYFFTRVVYYKNIIDQLEKIKIVNVTAFVPFLSCINFDSILCQFFRKHNVVSYGIQHGLHCSVNHYRYYIPLDVVNIENFQADFYLGWGDFSREVLVASNQKEDKFLLAGNPKYFNSKMINLSKISFKKVLICLARDIYYDANLELLEMAKKLQENNFLTTIKLHPRSDFGKYSNYLNKYNLKFLDLDTTVIDSITLKKPDFVIVYNSTTYYDYYINNILTLRYNKNADEIPFGLEDEFIDYNELLLVLNKFKHMKIDELNSLVNNMVNRFCALGINNYAEILNNKS